MLVTSALFMVDYSLSAAGAGSSKSAFPKDDASPVMRKPRSIAFSFRASKAWVEVITLFVSFRSTMNAASSFTFRIALRFVAIFKFLLL